jgi:hypothetical protein
MFMSGKIVFTIISEISDIETIAIENSIRDLAHLRKNYGQGRWRKLKGRAQVQLSDGSLCMAEIHWYEAHGIGRKEFKLKRVLFG